jgi:hypothetical protein
VSYSASSNPVALYIAVAIIAIVAIGAVAYYYLRAKKKKA